MEWRLRAACRGEGPARWYVGKGVKAEPALDACRRCPVVVDCLVTSVDANELYGIWGGAGEQTRRLLRRLRLAAHPEPGPIDGCACEWCEALRLHLARLRGEDVENRVLQRFGANATHGKRVTYAKGCRCLKCVFSASVEGQAVARLHIQPMDLWRPVPGESGELTAVRAAMEARSVLISAVAGIFAAFGHRDVRPALEGMRRIPVVPERPAA